MIHTTQILFGIAISVTFLLGGFYVDYRLWQWTWRFIKREWRKWKEDHGS